MSDKGTPDIERDEMPVEDEEIATHQEAIPVPYLAGTRRVAVRWITPALNLITQQAPDTAPGKK